MLFHSDRLGYEHGQKYWKIQLGIDIFYTNARLYGVLHYLSG